MNYKIINIRELTKILMMIALVFGFSKSDASHFRASSINWTNGSNDTIVFTIKQSWRKSAFTNVIVGSNIYTGTFNFGDNTTTNLILKVTTINVADDWFEGVAVIKKKYLNSVGKYTAFFRECCRIDNLVSGGGSYERTEVDVMFGGNNSPILGVPPILNMQVNQTLATFAVSGYDPDGDTFSFAFASTIQMGGGVNIPPGLTITPSGILSFNTIGKTVGQLFAVQLIITDSKGASAVSDFIIKIVPQSTPPSFDYSITPPNAKVISTSPGKTINFTVKATDIDQGNTVNLIATGLPSGASLSPNLPLIGNPVISNFSWTPSLSDLGTKIISFTATDNNNVQTTTSIIINVNTAPVFINPTPLLNSERYVEVGSSVVDKIVSVNPAPNVSTQIYAVDAPNGVILTPSLPLNFSDTSILEMTFTPTNSHFGENKFKYYARDSSGEIGTHEYVIIANQQPFFKSNPITSVVVGNQYSYTLVADDLDLLFGDSLEIENNSISNLPSWLTFNDNGDGTATLTGIPQKNDTGLINVSFLAADIYHHNHPDVLQNFTLQVIGKAPQLICPNDTVLNNLPGQCSNYFNFLAQDTIGIPQSSIIYSTLPGSEFLVGNSQVNIQAYNIIDTVACSFNITVVDNEKPKAICKPITVLLVNGSASISPNDIDNGSSDNCGIANMSLSKSSFNCSNIGVSNITLIVTDNSGNIDSCTTSVTIDSVAAPTASPQTFCTPSTVANLVATGSNLQWYPGGKGSDALSNATPLTTGTYYVTQTVNGCESPQTEVPISTTTPPIVHCPGNITTNVTPGQCSNNVMFAATAVDACNNAATIAYSTMPGSSFTGVTPLTVTATDALGNTASCAFNITVIDNEKPTINCPTDITVNTMPGQCGANVNYSSPTISDNCTLCYLPTSLPGYTYLGTYNGSTYFISQNYKLWPESNTLANATGGHLVSINNSGENAFLQSVAPTAFWTGGFQNLNSPNYSEPSGGWEWTDGSPFNFTSWNFGEPNNYNGDERYMEFVTYSLQWNDLLPNLTRPYVVEFNCINPISPAGGLPSGSFFPVGSSTIKYAGIDASGNTDTCAFNITVVDNEKPNAQCKPITISLVNGAATILANDINNGSTDNCGIASLAISQSTFDCSNIGVNNVTLTVTDVNGNVETCTTTVTVAAIPAPIATAQTFCNTGTVANLVPSGTQYNWYNAATATTPLAANTQLATGTYYVSQILNGCESPKTPVSVVYNNTPAPTAIAQRFCGSGKVAQLQATGTAIKWYNVSTGGTPLLATQNLSTATYYASQTLNGCESPRTPVSIKIICDFDGDNILDDVDIDDDNDGILDITEMADCNTTTTKDSLLILKPVSHNVPAGGPLFCPGAIRQNGYTFAFNGDFYTENDMVGTYTATYNYTGATPGTPATLYYTLYNVNVDAGHPGNQSTTLAVNNINVYSIYNNPSNIAKTYTFTPSAATGTVKLTMTFSKSVQCHFIKEMRFTGYMRQNATITTYKKCDTDTDGDGIVDRLDTDSDNDGCSDAFEAGATTSLVPNFVFANPVGTNGLANNLETVVDNGTINYTATAANAKNTAIANCKDSDNDNIPDITDLDDDNDGITDLLEQGDCPSTTLVDSLFILKPGSHNVPAGGPLFCPGAIRQNGYTFAFNGDFYTENDMVGTYTATYTYSNLKPGTPATLYYTFYNVNVDAGHPGNLSATLAVNGIVANSIANNPSSVAKTYTFTPSTANGTLTITMTFSKSVQCDFIKELKFTGNIRQNISVPSTKKCDKDTDGDGILDKLDLDSDNDGCPDALESGNSTTSTSFTTANVQASTMNGGNTNATLGTYNQGVNLNLGTTVGQSSTTMGIPTIAGTGFAMGSSKNTAIKSTACTVTPPHFRLASQPASQPATPEQVIDLYPNPFEGIINISYQATANANITCQILDISGKTMRSSQTNVSQGQNTWQLTDLENLPKGYYFVRIINATDGTIFTKKVVK